MREFTTREKEILRRVQGSIPDSATPFADIAREVSQVTAEDADEEQVLALLRSLKEEGVIRRFGATLKHQKAGYGANVMVAWKLDSEEEIHRLGPVLAENPAVSHCYYRPGTADWPYNLYTMVHGKSPDECLDKVRGMSRDTGLGDYETLFSTRELKKTSMTYFMD